MPRINSANPDAQFVDVSSPTAEPNYSHGLPSRRSFVPMAFQVTSPFGYNRVLLPHALVMHVNPQTYSESHTKKVERIQTRGGFVEQHWGDDLTEISADGSTGAFMNIYTGLTSVLRQNTIAWDRYRDLHDLYRNNGSLYDPFGNIVLQGNIMLMYDRGTYIGYFNKFDVEENDTLPFSFRISWSMKVTEQIMKIPGLSANPSQRGKIPAFQTQNAVPAQYQSTRNPQTLSDAQQAAADALAASAVTQAAKGG